MAVELLTGLGSRARATTRQLLDGVEFRLTVTWLPALVSVPFVDPVTLPLTFGAPGGWILDLEDTRGAPLLQGATLLHGVDVLDPFFNNARYPGRGLGRLVAWDFTGNQRDPGVDDFRPGAPVRLVYVTAAERT